MCEQKIPSHHPHKVTHLYSYHKEHGQLIPFANYLLPVWFKGITEEHLAVRNSAGVFDVSHMGRFIIRGREAIKFLDYLLPTALAKIYDGRCFYSVMCNEKGGILDDLVTLRIKEDEFIMVVNAINREKDFNWLSKVSVNFDVDIIDITDESALIALQGPQAPIILQKIVDVNLSNVKRYHHTSAKIDGISVQISRTGYTGEDGFEILIPQCPVDEPIKAEKIWNMILEVGKDVNILPCGLGARDTLRLEAGMILYGQDVDENTTPLEARLDWLIPTDKISDYVGKHAILEQRRKGVEKIRVGFVMKERGIPRNGYEILSDGKVVGRVTSGTFSPILRKGIGMGYISKSLDRVGGVLQISIRGALNDAIITTFPFYDTEKYGWNRKR
ncbi:MAG: glycine cleavage system aminomethyltransferase GcvT [Nitrososphaerales archaeon]|nr:glycine cleavage system aminomethyltransferase GcvT [Nitrososphaerales archaeon]